MILNNRFMENTVLQRIRSLIDYYHLSDRKFSERIGLPQTTVSSLFKRGNEPNISVVNAILSEFKDISMEWLLTGQGSMLRTASSSPSQHIQNRDGIVAGGSMIVPSHYAAQKIAEKKEGKLLEVKAELAGLKQENERLREEIDRLRTEILKFNERTEGAYRENETLKKENSELHKQLLESKDRLISMLMERK